jgi:hypothetical protein
MAFVKRTAQGLAGRKRAAHIACPPSPRDVRKAAAPCLQSVFSLQSSAGSPFGDQKKAPS